MRAEEEAGDVAAMTWSILNGETWKTLGKWTVGEGLGVEQHEGLETEDREGTCSWSRRFLMEDSGEKSV